jgi:hypothetical protein
MIHRKGYKRKRLLWTAAPVKSAQGLNVSSFIPEMRSSNLFRFEDDNLWTVGTGSWSLAAYGNRLEIVYRCCWCIKPCPVIQQLQSWGWYETLMLRPTNLQYIVL